MFKSIRQPLTVALLLAAAFSLGSKPATAQGKDALVGTWVLNFGKSDFKYVAPPVNKKLTITAVDNGFSQKVEMLTQNGVTDTMEFSGKYDGKEYPMPTESPLNSIVLKRIDANTVEQTGIRRKMPVQVVTYKVSGGGKVLTITTVGTDDHDNDYVQVFDKQ